MHLICKLQWASKTRIVKFPIINIIVLRYDVHFASKASPNSIPPYPRAKVNDVDYSRSKWILASPRNFKPQLNSHTLYDR